MSKKQRPASILNAQAALSQLEATLPADIFAATQKKLPAYAYQQEMAGTVLSAEDLVTAVNGGALDKKPTTKQKKQNNSYEQVLANKLEKKSHIIAAISVSDSSVYDLPIDASPKVFEKLAEKHEDLIAVKSPHDVSFIPRMGIATVAQTNNLKLYDFLFSIAGSHRDVFEKKAHQYAVKYQNQSLLEHIENNVRDAEHPKTVKSFYYDTAVYAAEAGHIDLCLDAYQKWSDETDGKNEKLLDKLYLAASDYGQEKMLFALDDISNGFETATMPENILKHTVLVRACEKDMLDYFEKHMPTRKSDLEQFCDTALERRNFAVVDLILSKDQNLADQYARRTVPRYNLSQPPGAMETYVLTKQASNLSDLCESYLSNNEEGLEGIYQAIAAAENWEKKTGMLPPKGCKEYNPAIFKPKTYKAVLKMLEQENVGKEAIEHYAFQAATLFRTTDRVLQYLEKWGDTRTTQPLHDIIYDINLPKTGGYDLKAWGDAVMQHGPKMTRLVAFADKMVAPQKSINGKTYSYQKTLHEVAKREYQNSADYPEISQLAFAAQYTEGDFECAVDLLNEFNELASNDVEVSKNIPNIRIEGDLFGRKDYHFRKLEPGDVRAMFLGSITDCCQHIAGAGSECAEHGFTSEDGGFYVIAHNDTDNIIGQAWAWRGAEGELVLDSLEAKTGLVKAQEWRAILAEMTKQIQSHDMKQHKITALNVGDAGRTPANLSENDERVAAHPSDYNGYRDSHSQYRIWKR